MIEDSSGSEISTLNQIMAFPVRAFSRDAEAIIILGIDIRKSMERNEKSLKNHKKQIKRN